MQRRQFLQLSSTTAMVCFLEAHLGCAASPVSLRPASDAPLIRSIRLQTQVPLEEMKDFYGNKIGFQILEQSAERLVLKAGFTEIVFTKAPAGTDAPYYHFAFNIPENKILEAYEWQKAKTPIILPRPGARNEQRSKGHPKEVYHFQRWNAHSIFFLDPAENLVEYIARHELKNASIEPGFSTHNLQFVSEIGFIVDDPLQMASWMEEKMSLRPYFNNSPSFQPMGDAMGLLLLLQSNTLWTNFSGEGHPTSVFPTEVHIQKEKAGAFSLPAYPYVVMAQQ